MLSYLKDVRAELAHVSWPSRRQTVMYTVVVIIVSVLTAAYLGILDFLFTELLKRII